MATLHIRKPATTFVASIQEEKLSALSIILVLVLGIVINCCFKPVEVTTLKSKAPQILGAKLK
jgi:hypothetical protein